MAPATPARRPAWRRALPATLAAAIAVVLTGLVSWATRTGPEPRSATRFDYVLPTGQEFANTARPVIAAIPDGRGFVYQAQDGLYLRPMGELAARLIPGAVGITPFVSPDGEWVGYFGAGGLRKINVSGGTPVTLCAATIPFGASWATDGTILFGQREGIMRVSANGGTPELLIRAADNEELYGPQLMPDGQSLLFSVTTARGPNRWDQGQVVVQSLATGARTVVVNGGMDARYLSTGHIVYTVRDTLFGIPFDAGRQAVTAGARPLVQGVSRPVGLTALAAHYAVSNDGTLVFVTTTVSQRSLVWRRRGASADEPIATIPPGVYEDPRLSPDGSRLLLTNGGDIWIYDIASGRSSRITRDGVSLMGVWHPAGREVAYSSAAGGNLEAWVTEADGGGQPRQVTKLGGQIHVDSWSPDGRTLNVHRHGERSVDILMVSMDDDRPGPARVRRRQAQRRGRVVFVRHALRGVPLPGQRAARDLHPAVRRARRTSHRLGRWRQRARCGAATARCSTAACGGIGCSPCRSAPHRHSRSVRRCRCSTVPISFRLRTHRVRIQRLSRRSALPDARNRPGRGRVSARGRIVVVKDWFEELKRLLPAN